MYRSVTRDFARGFRLFFQALPPRRIELFGCVFLFAAVLASALSINAEGVWEKTAGPPGIEVTVLYKANNFVFAGTEHHGVWRSGDGGATWAAANNGIARTQVSDIIASGPNLLAAVAASRCPASLNVFKSTDNGATWTPTSGLAGHVVQTLAKKGNVLYAGFPFATSSGLYRSIDDGNTWQVVSSFIDDGDKIFVSDNAILVAAANFIWRTVDDGVKWDVVEQFAFSGIQGFARVGTKLFAVSGGIMLVSTDNGATWKHQEFANGLVSSFASDGAT